MAAAINFSGKNYLITGAASGIGLATARLLKQHGAVLVLWDFNAGALEQTAQELQCHFKVVDVAQPDAVQAGFAEAISQVGRLDGVIHSAGILRTGPFESLDIDTHRRTIEIDLFGAVAVAYAALPYLKQSHGSLIFLGSGSAFWGTAEFNSYGAAKAGVLNLAQALRTELAGTGVHVGVVNPLFVGSPMLDETNRQAKYIRRFGIVHTPEQVAEAILKGLDKRRFMIWPSPILKTRGMYWATRHLHFAAPLLMRLLWR
ncbi:MAG: short-chain dehydrogenase [Chloroflexi bacterium]|nr:short-chain dehydrogenase [Chloroflexota bacterium]